MIVRDRPSGLKLFLLLRGSVLQQIWKVLLINVLLATLVTFTHGVLFSQKITLTAIPVSYTHLDVYKRQVFTLVVGATLLVLTALAHQSVRSHRYHARATEDLEAAGDTTQNGDR